MLRMKSSILPIFLPRSLLKGKLLMIQMSLLIFALILDMSMVRIQPLYGLQQNLYLNNLIFLFVATISVYCQYLILCYIDYNIKGNRIEVRTRISKIAKIVIIAQLSVTVIYVASIVQTIVTSSYPTSILSITTTISYGLALILIVILAKQFLAWFREKRSIIVLVYSLASFSIAANLAFTMIFVLNIMQGLPEVTSQREGFSPFFRSDLAMKIFQDLFFASSIISFILTWLATAILLMHYSHRIGVLTYWIIIFIPLIYFLTQFINLLFNLFSTLFESNPVFFGIIFTLLFTLSRPAGGILFGTAFWIISRSIPKNVIVKNYLIISAYGFVLLFISNQAIILISAPVPPFGLASVSFVGVSSFLILIGIYYSAISVAQDSELRQSIRRVALREGKILDSIGTAQMERDIVNNVAKLSKEHKDIIEAQTGVESSLNDDEITQYIEEVLVELKKKKNA